jgi:hypothetical protein
MLWEVIASTVGIKLSRDNRPSAQTVSRWVTILLDATYPEGSARSLDLLLYNCQHPDDNLAALLLFERLAGPRSTLERGLELPGMRAPRQEIELEGEPYALREAWDTMFKPNLAVFAKSLAPILAGHLQRAHLLLCSTGEASSTWDPLSWLRSAIEPHEQDLLDTGVDLLVDTARDTLEWMVEHEPEHAQRMIETWVTYHATLLRRLSVYGVTESSTMDSDEKLKWVLDEDLLFAYGLKHEVFRLLAIAYPNASEPCQTQLLDRALRGPQGGDEQGFQADIRQYEIYNLLVWLHQVAPDSSLTTQQFEEIQQAHADDFQPRDHPDLDSYVTHLAPTRSPVTVDELLAQDPAELIELLRSYEGDSGTVGITRGRLLETAAQAVTRSYSWGQRLIAELQERELWGSDLWKYIIEGWRERDLAEQQWEEVLAFLIDHPEIYAFANEIANLLEKSSRDSGDGVVQPSRLSLSETLAERLWETFRDPPAELHDTDEWHSKAINHPGGKLARFWLLNLSRKRVEAGENWQGLTPENQAFFDKVLSGRSYAAELGRIVLVGQLSFLFSSDADWTRNNVLPLLDWSVDARTAQQAWHGFLSQGQWSEALLPALLPLYEATSSHMPDLPQPLRREFSTHLASIAVYSSSNPLEEGWLGRFLQAAEPEDRANWAFAVGFILRQLDEDAIRVLWDRWLAEYWAWRNAGMPLPLAPSELENMIDWSLNLTPVFPEVVANICASIPSTVIMYSRRFLPRLADSGNASRYPEDVANLLRYLLPHASQPFMHCEHVTTMFRQLLRSGEVAHSTLDQICNELGALGCSNAAELRELLR